MVASVLLSSDYFSFDSYPFEVINCLVVLVLLTFLFESILQCFDFGATIGAKVYRGRVANAMMIFFAVVLAILLALCGSVITSGDTTNDSYLVVAAWMTCIWMVWDLLYRFSGIISMHFLRNFIVIVSVQFFSTCYDETSAAIYAQWLWFVVLMTAFECISGVVGLLGSFRVAGGVATFFSYLSLCKCMAFFIWGWVLFADLTESGESGALYNVSLPFSCSVNIFNFLFMSFTCFNWLVFGLYVDCHPSDNMAAEDRYRHPMETCSAASQMTLCWMEPMLWIGSRRPLQLDDVYDLPYVSRSAAINRKFDDQWNLELENVRKLNRENPDGNYEPSLCKVLLRAFGKFRYIAPFQCSAIVALLTTPILVYAILLRLDAEDNSTEAYAEAVGLWLSLCLSAFSTGQSFHYCNHMAVNVESACMNAVYRKLFLLSTSSLQATGSSMVNMLSGDSQRVYMMFYALAHMTNVLGTFAACILLFWYVGYAGFTALIILLLVVPFQFWLGHNMHFIRADMVCATDRRVQQTSEFLSGVRLIKMQGWENTFKQKITEKRDRELMHLWRLFRFRITNSMATFTLPTATTTFTFIVYYAVFGNTLEVASAFATLSVLSIMRPGFFLLPIVLISMAEGSVAIKRFQKFLCLDNMKVSRVINGNNATNINAGGRDGQSVQVVTGQQGNLVGGGRGYSVEAIEEPDLEETMNDEHTWAPIAGDSGVASIAGSSASPVVLKNASFEYFEASDLQNIVKEGSMGGPVGPPQGNLNDDIEEEKAPLNAPIMAVEEKGNFKKLKLNIDHLEIKQGQLVCVVGKVGSGKTSLVQAMLGELHQLNGHRSLNGRVSYVGQDVWIINDTVRNNIIFNQPFDEDLYEIVKEAAQLSPDLRVMPAGDMTVVGERGVTMSGGQKARLSLARCLYRALHADTFIMDDILAALDMQTLKAVLEKAVHGPNALLRNKTRIIVVNSNYYEILQAADQIVVMRDGDFQKAGVYEDLREAFPEELCVEQERQDAKKSAAKDEKEFDSKKAAPSLPMAPEDTEEMQTDDTKGHDGEADEEVVKKPYVSEAALRKKGKLGGEEHRVVGILDMKLYHDYFTAAFRVNGTFVFVCINFFIILAQVGAVMSDVWLADWAAASDDGITDSENWYYIDYFLMILGIVFVCAFSKACFFMCTAWRSGKRLHERALDKLVKAPIHEYFDVVPTGRILNRFSKDMDAVDLLLVDFLFEFLETAWFICILLFVCAYSVPEMLIVFFPLMYIFFKVRIMFSKSSREMKRIESTSRSPVFSTFGETVTGLSHIRAYGEVEAFKKQYCDHLDAHLKTTFHLNEVTPWNIIRLDLIGSIIVLSIALSTIAFEGTLSYSMSALALAYSVQLESRLTEAVWKSIETENYMTQMERLEHFQHIPQETSGGIEPPKSWPEYGQIVFDDIVFRYRKDLPDVLKKVNFSVSSTEHMGVCGRTGSGKSSLMVVLFRLGELRSGHISIDGLDISKIKLQALREKISIIPQMPWLFRGTLRQNCDPSGQRSDSEIMEALKHSHLHDWVMQQEEGLDFEVVERGANLSQGQRQLLCIARALVRQCKVVMLDEATANIDSGTDELIQATIRTQFKETTSLTIAHRLSTIADSDRILVLSLGKRIECDSPLKLLEHGSSNVGFAALCRELAPDSLDQIHAIARHKAENNGSMLDVVKASA